MKDLPRFDLDETPLAPGTTLIEASAGTGKTYTIAGLFVRFVVEHDLAVSEILVTTYTKPATAELRDRIRRRLGQALEAFETASDDPFLAALVQRQSDPGLARTRLARALRNFDEAAIYTIHGFCQRMLQDRAFESALPFTAELLTEQTPILREVAEDFWRLQLYQRDPVLTALALLSKVSTGGLVRRLGEVANKPLLVIEPEPGRLAELQAEISALFAELRALWPLERTAITRLFTTDNGWASGATQQGKPDKMQPALDALDTIVGDAGAPLSAFAELGKLTQSKMEKATKKSQAVPRQRIFELCECFDPRRVEYALALQVEFLAWARGELVRRKQRRNVLSFDDLLTRLHDALNSPGGDHLASLIRQRFRAAMIDEFQDTDAIQETSFRRIFASGAGWLYLIGDPKQAIYAFRGADVFTYLAAADRAREAFTLDTNFRSESALVTAVNSIFERTANVFAIEGIHFRPAQAAGRQDETPLTIGGQRVPPFQVWWWNESDPIKAGTANERLPRATAAQIARRLAGEVKIDGRSVEPRDFAVLVATHAQAGAVQTALGEFGIPAVLHSSANVFESTEANDLQAILAAVAEPARDGLIRAALATPILGSDAAQIEALSRDERGWENTLLRFQQHRETWAQQGFIQMFREVLQSEHVRPRLLALLDGERRLTNLLHLSELLHQAATTQRLGIASLLKWLGDQRADGAPKSEERELRLESDADAVQVVTMHKSKGLEYNIVFCPFSWGKASLRNGESVVYHDPAHDDRLTLDLGSADLDAHATLAARERLAEQVRLLYVTLTRARHQCHFVWGRFNTHEASAAAWVLHPPPATEADPWAAFAAHAEQLAPEQMRRELAALEAAAPEAIAVHDLPDEDAPRFAVPRATDAALVPRHFTGRIARDWRIASFTSWTTAREAEQPDFDRIAGPPVPEVAATGIHAFPRGAKVGVCLHELFEELDFQNPASIEPLVARKLAGFGLDTPDQRAAVTDNVRRVLALPLADGLTLAQIPPAARLNELEFYFPFSRLEASALAAHFGPLPTGIGRVEFDPQRGFVKGFIDLIFEHHGRFYLLDWKSNWLGPDTAAYHPEAVRAEMVRHHYVLQYHLYIVALHRYLAQRLADYDYERHFGGVFYLFLRGIDPGQPTLGVHRDRPAAEFIEELSALFAREVVR